MSTTGKISDMKNIGLEIKKRRKELGLTQKDVADRLCITAVSIVNWEKNKNEPNGKNLLMLAKVLQCKPEELTGIKSQQKTEIERQAELIQKAYLGSTPEMQAAVRRIFGILEDH